ncbi:DNA-directed RNA polymerases II, IV and V subunit 3-like [Pyrus ussuriensis x Pyrus communis]|uniref:DNA-directed RNA polymerases II, IV and V subunit 3-like n=1 Tax=Pyrus ussuriensis x Pyrus communis TaxID=2448454 RepID=A0A5N5HU87_9ROSA|nr:DNA-directed RNA polymerases II, IV and V subunit 3-like [Pyrus ussuriensis x Pyrus communis]
MAPKVARTQSPCKTGEGISTMHHLLNGLHRPRASLCTISSFCFRTSMALRSSQATLIAPVDSTCGYKAILSCIDIHKFGLPHSFYFLDHFIIISVYFGIDYHDLISFRINVKGFGRTCGRKLCYEDKDHKGIF